MHNNLSYRKNLTVSKKKNQKNEINLYTIFMKSFFFFNTMTSICIEMFSRMLIDKFVVFGGDKMCVLTRECNEMFLRWLLLSYCGQKYTHTFVCEWGLLRARHQLMMCIFHIRDKICQLEEYLIGVDINRKNVERGPWIYISLSNSKQSCALKLFVFSLLPFAGLRLCIECISVLNISHFLHTIWCGAFWLWRLELLFE